jgi:TetR/AcrR family transcriptional regulator, tetracycline repressor protein
VSAAERPPLSRERIVTAALALIDAHGVEALSMRKLGAYLGVEAMSLYNHVASKEDLLDGVVDRLLESVVVPPGSGSWRDDVLALCRSVRSMGHAHPRAFPLLAHHNRTSFDSWEPTVAGFRLVRAAGLSPAQAVQVVNAVSAYLIGFVLMEVNAVEHHRRHGPSFAVDEVPANRPALREYLSSRPDVDPEEEFQQGIALLLAGVEALAHGAGPS